MANNAGKRVKVHYTGTFDDGVEFDSSKKHGQPLEFDCMAGQMIPGFDKAVAEMELNETRTVHIPAAEAYGERDESLVQQIPLEHIPRGEELPVGEIIYMQAPNGQALPVKVVAVENGMATFDMNHEMAGRDLNFEITLVEIVD